MNKVRRLALLSAALLAYAGEATAAHHEQSHLKLDSRILSIVDGSFINADTIERIRTFQRDLINILWGDKGEGNTRIGRYSFDGRSFGAQKLMTFEEELRSMTNVLSKEEYADLSRQLARCLLQMKADLLKSSNKLKSIASGAKATMGVLIEESCTKRKRRDSVLMTWAKASEEEEDAIFEHHVKTILAFYTFSIDLLNFLGDLVFSCPRATAQFEQRMLKWEKIKSLLSSINLDISTQKEFLKYLKINYLDKLSINDITPAKLKSLAVEFRR